MRLIDGQSRGIDEFAVQHHVGGIRVGDEIDATSILSSSGMRPERLSSKTLTRAASAALEAPSRNRHMTICLTIVEVPEVREKAVTRIAVRGLAAAQRFERCKRRFARRL